MTEQVKMTQEINLRKNVIVVMLDTLSADYMAYYMNVKKDEKRGITFWLYPKRDGGAAAVYFDKKSKVYSMNFEAVKTKVAGE